MHVTAGEAKYWYHYIFANWRELILLEDIVAGYARSTFRNYRGKFPSREDPIRCADNTTHSFQRPKSLPKRLIVGKPAPIVSAERNLGPQVKTQLKLCPHTTTEMRTVCWHFN